MAQARAYEYAHEAVDKQRIEQLGAYFLLLVEPLHYEVSQQQAHKPAQRIPPHAQECGEVGVPHDVCKRIHDVGFYGCRLGVQAIR